MRNWGDVLTTQELGELRRLSEEQKVRQLSQAELEWIANTYRKAGDLERAARAERQADALRRSRASASDLKRDYIKIGFQLGIGFVLANLLISLVAAVFDHIPDSVGISRRMW